MKFLVIRFSSIGDIVLASPALRCLKKQVITSEVHFLTKPDFASILSANPHVSKVIEFSEDFDDMVTRLKAESYDHIIDLHHNLRSK